MYVYVNLFVICLGWEDSQHISLHAVDFCGLPVRGVSQVVAALMLALVAVGAVSIHFSLIQPMISAPRGAVALSITRDPELVAVSSNQVVIRVEVKIYNPLTESIRVTSADVTFLFRGPAVPVLTGRSCSVAGSTSGILVPAGSVTHSYIACEFVSGTLPYNHLLVAACGSINCLLIPQLLASAMKSLEIVSIVYYFTTAGGEGVCVSSGDIERCYYG
jgi:hypothetical protein